MKCLYVFQTYEKYGYRHLYRSSSKQVMSVTSEFPNDLEMTSK